jgi:hypothetical protein
MQYKIWCYYYAENDETLKLKKKTQQGQLNVEVDANNSEDSSLHYIQIRLKRVYGDKPSYSIFDHFHDIAHIYNLSSISFCWIWRLNCGNCGLQKRNDGNMDPVFPTMFSNYFVWLKDNGNENFYWLFQSYLTT